MRKISFGGKCYGCGLAGNARLIGGFTGAPRFEFGTDGAAPNQPESIRIRAKFRNIRRILSEGWGQGRIGLLAALTRWLDSQNRGQKIVINPGAPQMMLVDHQAQ